MRTFTDADLAYLGANFRTLSELCAGRREAPEHAQALIDQGLLPQPSYVLDDGTGLFPPDCFRLCDDAGGPALLPSHFASRYFAACRAAGAVPDALEDDWRGYLSGVYGVCLREVTPETIVRKGVLVTSLCELLVLARPEDADWRARLREQVAELDALEREFAPDYDRGGRFGRPPTRDLLVAGARERFPEVFAAAAAAA